MDLTDFNNDYLNPLLAKLSKEKKIALRNQCIFRFSCLIYVLPYIIQPTRVTSNTKTIIDKIFSNIISTDIILGNQTTTIFDHLLQFLIVPEILINSPSNKSNYFECDWSNFNQENFILGYFLVNWKNVINLQKNDINHFLQIFFDSLIDLLKIHAPYKKIKKYKLKFKEKSWSSSSLQKSISIKKLNFQEKY